VKKFSASVKEDQKVNFLFDDCKDLSGLSEIKFKKYKKIFIIFDKALSNSWVRQISEIIKKSKSDLHYIPLRGIENIKSLREVEKLLYFLEESGCSKNDLIVSIGGGTILDLSAFVASIYMRGVELMMIPTTLMGQADASSAGKTCINGKQTKNLVGSLYMPLYVYNNIHILKTADRYSRRQGLSEIFKYGLLGSKKLIRYLEQYARDSLENDSLLIKILIETIKVRIKLRKIDPLVSNLGHTFGHAFESESKNLVAHGDAISAGIVCSLKLSLKKRYISKKLYFQLIKVMRDLNLNINIDKSSNVKRVVNLMKKDKKSDGDLIGFVLLKDIGKTVKTMNKKFLFLDAKYVTSFLIELYKEKDFLVTNHWKQLTKNV
jgi:3-dehydroquinate synthetase